MKTNHWMNTIGVLLLSLCLFKPASSSAQTLSIQSGSTIGAAQDSIVQIAAESQGLAQLAPEDLPIMGGTFWWVMLGGNAVPAPCAPLDLSGVAIYQISEQQFLVDQTGGQVVMNPSRFGLQTQYTSSAAASEAASQVDAVVNLITRIQTSAAEQQTRATMQAMGMDVPSPGDGDGDGGTNSYMSYGSSYVLPEYGTNLYIAQVAIQSGNLTGIISNTVSYTPYQILSCENLAQVGNWAPEGALVYGSENTNWTPFSVVMNNRQNLFIRILSWQDSTATGIPDWWWLKFFGQITNVDAYADPDNDGWNNLQEFQNGTSPIAFNAPPAPTGLYAYVDSTGTNVLVSWNSSSGPTNYVVYRSDYNENTGDNGPFQQVGEVNGNTNSFKDIGLINSANDYNGFYSIYELQAVYPGGTSLVSDPSYVYSSPFIPPTYNYNIYLTANLVRNATGRWQVMFSGFPTNSAQTIQLIWFDPNWFFDNNNSQVVRNITTSTLTNGIYQISDVDIVTVLAQADTSLSVQLFGPNEEPGQVVQVGTLPNDAPYFVDGRQHMKQNLNFLIRAASLYGPFGGTYNDYSYSLRLNQSATNFEEFSFLYHDTALDNLWPFAANYYLANFLADTTRTNGEGAIGFGAVGRTIYANTNFNFQLDFNTIPAPPILTHSDPYWIIQPGFNYWYFYNGYNLYTNTAVTTNWGVNLSSSLTEASLQSGINNLFGLPYNTGCMIDSFNSLTIDPSTGLQYWYGVYQPLSPGDNITAEYVTNGYSFGAYASWCPAPTLQLTNYYFAPLTGTNMNPMNLLPVSQQPFPLPINDTFKVTNQTPSMIVGSVGQPMILGAWAKYSIRNGSTASGKYGYLGQYFVTNAFLLNTNGVATTNTAGILSPYGEFFPTQAGLAALVTMPDIDPPHQQGTGVVRIVSVNADANHDGTLDFSYFGPDQTSPSRPFRFWANDNQDIGDYGGDGVPGQGSQGNGVQKINGVWQVHGRRDLVDFFPVYLNIGSLFQSNTLSAGISATDTNWQFVLSQADGVLRFAYTDLTPTNYMNFLRDTNKSGVLANALLTTITNVVNGGVALSQSFVSAIATNNEGIILVEAAAPTTQPLILSIYHGTNLVGQTSLYLSISGVEQMFRYKNLLIGAATNQTGLLPDRLTDANVPNEPDTIEKNVVFVHGYNVNSYQARGWFADMFKRLYWSGSHAKFYGVNWYGNDSQGHYVGGVTANYQTNVVHAFQTAPLLANFIATLTNGPTVVAAHSLGNMLTLSAISDYGAPVSQYFMVDAAVPMEAIDPSTPINTNMVYSTSSAPWLNYATALWASKWFNVWPSSDARYTLTWSNRLGSFGSTTLYNFYSSGEEVLRTYSGAPPSNLILLFGAQLVQWIEGQSGTFVWAWQEKDKGQMSGNTILSSDHGGWGLNENLNSGYVFFVNGLRTNIPPAVITNSVLQTNAFFDMSVDTAMFTASSSGSAYAQTNRNRILSDAIPAVTLPIGANPVSRLAPQNGNNQNFDMQTLYENGWPLGRGAPSWPAGTTAFGEWHHSDVRVVAYTFTYQLFNKMVTTGNLK
jgi:pimeloyl-ACP methyl ester carboxylesterase